MSRIHQGYRLPTTVPEEPRSVRSFQAGDPDRALASIERAFELRRGVLTPSHPDTVDALKILFAIRRERGALAEMIEPLRATLAAWEETPPVRALDGPLVRSYLGEGLADTVACEEARLLIEGSLAELEEAGHKRVPRMMRLLDRLADCRLSSP